MPITAEQRERRKHFLGASDIPAVLGVSPFQSAYDIFLQKTQNMAEFDSEAADAGTRFEAPVMDWAEEQLGPIERNIEIVSAKLPFLMVHLDGRLFDGLRPVEAKTSGLFYRLIEDGEPGKFWGEPNTDQVPDYVAVQAYGQMYATDTEVCFIPAFLGGRGFNLFHVERREDVMTDIMERCQDFWENCVLKGIPPADSAPSLDVVKRIQREPGEIVALADELVERWKEAQDAAKIASQAEEAAKATVIAALGAAEDGKCSLGNVTYYLQNRASYVAKATSFRVLRLVKPKKSGK